VTDSDGDGLTDGLEVSKGYNPASPDSDNDGVNDGYEDYDADGLANLVEASFGTDPWSFDNLDGDGVADWKDDSDGDGLPDAYERNVSGTSPVFAEGPPPLPSPLDKRPTGP